MATHYSNVSPYSYIPSLISVSLFCEKYCMYSIKSMPCGLRNWIYSIGWKTSFRVSLTGSSVGADASLSNALCTVSSQHKWNLEELMEEIWDRTNMLRIYPKVRCKTRIIGVAVFLYAHSQYRSRTMSIQPKGQVPDYDEPVILRAENPTIEEFCNRLHKGLLAEFSHAWVCKCEDEKLSMVPAFLSPVCCWPIVLLLLL